MLEIKPLYSLQELCELFHKNKPNSLYKLLKNNNVEMVIFGHSCFVSAETIQQVYPAIWRALLVASIADKVINKSVEILLEDEALTAEIKKKLKASDNK